MKALQIMKGLRNNSTITPWVHQGTGGCWTLSNNEGDVVAYEINHGYNADLIALLKNTIDAQIAVLEAAVSSPGSSPLQESVVDLTASVIEHHKNL